MVRAAWAQGDDAIHFDGLGGARLRIDVGPYQGIAVATSFDVVTTIGSAMQHQIAFHPVDSVAAPHQFTELNDVGATHHVQVTDFDGTTYNTLGFQNLVTTVHPGRLDFVTVAFSGGDLRIVGGWPPQEIYIADQATSTFSSASAYFIDTNWIVFDLRYLWIISW